VDGVQIARTRLRNLLLSGTPSADPVAVLRRLGAIQAQEFPYARWSLGQRVRNATDADVLQTFDDGGFLRTHVLRPTWHFVLPRDISWMLKLTAPRVKKMMGSSDRRLELNEQLYSRTNRLILRWLGEGRHLTRKEIIERFRKAKIEGTGQRFGHIMLRAELEGLICSGATRGIQQTYALLDERAPDALSLDEDEALEELTRRYFETRGPATLRDYSWWCSLRMSDCRRGIDMLDDAVTRRELDGLTYWSSRPSARPATRKRITLVQVYDECVVSYSSSRHALFPETDARVPNKVAFNWHPILLDAQIAGQWRQRKERGGRFLEVYWFVDLTREVQEAFEEELRRYEAFIGGSVSVRPAATARAAGPSIRSRVSRD
jgi:hypothetical protein